MSLSTLALASMLPTAARTVGSVASSTLRASGDFLSSLSSSSPAKTDESGAAAGTETTSGTKSSRTDLQAKTEAWGRKLIQFLRSKGIDGPISLTGSLNQLDQPEIQATGENQQAIEQALKETADFFSEFRDLAFQAASQQPSLTNSLSGQEQGNSQLSTTRLSLRESFGSLTTDWNLS